MSKRVCIIIPAYNEEVSIASVIRSTINVFKDSSFSADIIVVDDGSKDKTGHIAKKNGAIVVRHIVNSGAGGATATGLRYAEINQYDICATMDADGQHNPKDVLTGVMNMSKSSFDILIGSRLINPSGMSKLKVIGNKGLSVITAILFGIKTTDSQSGLRVFSRNAIETLRWKTNGYEFCSEMLWRAHQLNLRVEEFPIEAIYTEYSVGKGQSNWNAINIVKSLLKSRVMELFE